MKDNINTEQSHIDSLIGQIANVNDELRDLFLELSNIIAMREFKGELTIIDGEEIKLDELGKYKEYLEEIRKFALFV